MNNAPSVDILMVVHNGVRWLPHVLDGVRAQTHGQATVHLLDSASTDGTGTLVRERYPEVLLQTSTENIGIWAGMEQLLGQTHAPYVLVLTDVVLAPDYLERGLTVLERRPTVGAVQARILQGTWTESGLRREQTIDTLGFAVSRGRKVTNEAQGTPDRLFDEEVIDIFGVEGAAPLFRRTSLDDCRIDGRLIDPDYRIGALGYGDDLDLAWRMRLFGHEQVLVPAMRAWHDRSTTRSLGHGILNRLRRRGSRHTIPLMKRQLDWMNVRFTILKNDQWQNVLLHSPWMIWWQVMTLGYIVLFEPNVLRAVPRALRLMPRMLRRRNEVMHRARVQPRAMRRFFI